MLKIGKRLQNAFLCLLFCGLLLPKPCAANIPPPLIVVQPSSITVQNSGTSNLTVVASSLGTMTYQWIKDGANIPGATASSYAITNAAASDAGTYAVKVSNSGGTTTSSTAVVNVLGPPQLTANPQNQAVILGQAASFSVSANSSATMTYQWSFNGGPLPGATTSSLTLTNVQTNQAGNYYAVVANSSGSSTSAVATLTVNVPATITTQPQSQTVTKGQDVSFSVVAGGTAPFTYQWYFGGSSLGGGANASTYSLSSADSGKAGNYTVVVKNNYGSVTSAVATLTVLASAVSPSITTQPQSQTIVAGQSATFNAAATGTGPLSYRWQRNGAPLTWATNATLNLTNVGTSATGNFTLVVTNSAGSITSAIASLTVTIPSFSLSAASSGGGGMTSTGFTFQFNVPVGCTYVILASPDFSNWSPIATNVANTASVVFTDAAAANYRSRFYRVVVH